MERIIIGNGNLIVAEVFRKSNRLPNKEKDYIDESKTLFRGEKTVENIHIYDRVIDKDGQFTNEFRLVTLDSNQIKQILDFIEKIKSETILSEEDHYFF